MGRPFLLMDRSKSVVASKAPTLFHARVNTPKSKWTRRGGRADPIVIPEKNCFYQMKRQKRQQEEQAKCSVKRKLGHSARRYRVLCSRLRKKDIKRSC